jgi:hypothetical protein
MTPSTTNHRSLLFNHFIRLLVVPLTPNTCSFLFPKIPSLRIFCLEFGSSFVVKHSTPNEWTGKWLQWNVFQLFNIVCVVFSWDLIWLVCYFVCLFVSLRVMVFVMTREQPMTRTVPWILEPIIYECIWSAKK